MNHLNVVTNALRSHMGGLVNWLLSCSHRRTTFPRTLRPGAGSASGQTGWAETYIVCLDCGRHLAYDWARMQVAERGPASAPRWTLAGRVAGRE